MSGCLPSAYLWEAEWAGEGFCSSLGDTEPQVFAGGHREQKKLKPQKSVFHQNLQGHSQSIATHH